jgi:hypothetical protein
MPTRIGRPSLFKNKQHRRTTFLSDAGKQALERHRRRLAELTGRRKPTDSDTIEFALLGEERAVRLMSLSALKAVESKVTRAVRRPH